MKPHLFFVGIASEPMRSLAVALEHQGYQVSGFGEAGKGQEEDISGSGINTATSKAEQVDLDGVQIMVISSETPANHPLVLAAQRQNLPVQSLAEFIGVYAKEFRVISVAGTYGKTTTTALIAWLLEATGKQPSLLLEAQAFNFETRAQLSDSQLLVLNGDVDRASALEDRSGVEYLHPDVLVLTSTEFNHQGTFASEVALRDRFRQIIGQLPLNGLLVAWADDPTVMELAATAPCQVVGYGIDNGDYIARNIAYLPAGLEFDIETSEGVIGRIAVPLFGQHNVLNCLAAVAVATREGLPTDQIIEAAAGFKGVLHRFNVVTAPDADVTVIDDTAQHLTEVAATLQAARLHFPGRRLIGVINAPATPDAPHLAQEYQSVLNDAAERVYLWIRDDCHRDAPSTQDPAQTGESETKEGMAYVNDKPELIAKLTADAIAGDVVVCMSADGMGALAKELVKRLNSAVTT